MGNLVCSEALSSHGPAMLMRTITMLEESKKSWPLACRWLEGLKSFSAEKKGMVKGHEGSMADGVCPDFPRLASLTDGPQRDPIPQVLYPSTAEQPGPPTTPLDDKSKMRRMSMQYGGSPGSSAGLPIPMPDMLIDASIRLPAPNPQILPALSPVDLPPSHHAHQAGYQHHVQNRPPNSLDLLAQASSFDSHSSGHDPNAGYYDQPVTNDGYASELEFYIGGAPNLQTSVWGAGGMYGNE